MIKKLEFSKAKSIGEDFDIIADKIDEIIEVVNKVCINIKALETNSPQLSRALSDITGEAKISISDLEARESIVANIKAGSIEATKINIDTDEIKVINNRLIEIRKTLDEHEKIKK